MSYSIEFNALHKLWYVTLFENREWFETESVFNSAEEALKWVKQAWPHAECC